MHALRPMRQGGRWCHMTGAGAGGAKGPHRSGAGVRLQLRLRDSAYSESMRTAFLLLLAPAKGNSTRQNSVAAGDSFHSPPLRPTVARSSRRIWRILDTMALSGRGDVKHPPAPSATPVKAAPLGRQQAGEAALGEPGLRALPNSSLRRCPPSPAREDGSSKRPRGGWRPAA